MSYRINGARASAASSAASRRSGVSTPMGCALAASACCERKHAFLLVIVEIRHEVHDGTCPWTWCSLCCEVLVLSHKYKMLGALAAACAHCAKAAHTAVCCVYLLRFATNMLVRQLRCSAFEWGT